MKFDDPIFDVMLEYYTIIRDFTLKSFDQFKSNMLSLYQRTSLIEVDNSFHNLSRFKRMIYSSNVKYLDPTLPEPEKILLFPMIEHAAKLLKNKQLNELEEFIVLQPHLASKFSSSLRVNLLSKNPTKENAMVYFNSPMKYENYTDDNIRDYIIFLKFDRRTILSQILRHDGVQDWYSFTVELSKSINVPPSMGKYNKGDLEHKYCMNMRGQEYLEFCTRIVSSEERLNVVTYASGVMDGMVTLVNTQKYEDVLILYNQNKQFISYYLRKTNDKFSMTIVAHSLLLASYFNNQLNSCNDVEVLLEDMKLDEMPSKLMTVAEQNVKKLKSLIKNIIDRVERNGFSIYNTADEADQIKFLKDVDDQKCCVICLSSIESITTVIQCGKCKMNIGHLKCLNNTWNHAKNTKCPYCRH
jgi:hypothetical protein